MDKLHELSKLEKLFLNTGVVITTLGIFYGFFCAGKIYEKERILPSENIAVTNRAITNYWELSSNDLERISYEQLEIKPYEK